MNTILSTHYRAVARLAVAAGLALMLASPAYAGDVDTENNPSAPPSTERAKPALITIDRLRPHDARGLNVFEPPKQQTVEYNGFQLMWGAAFTQQYQDLNHENTALPNIGGTPPVNLNQLISIGSGFNNADANLYLDAQLGRGIRVSLTSYMSSRHHPEMWVKDGYLLIDGSPWEHELLDNIMEVVTLRLGHFEINYGDQHFRRTDNGQAMFNPLVGNLIMDAFTTEIGAEIYARKSDFLAMAALTGGEVRGQVLKPENRSPAFMGKLGFDRQFNEQLRARVTGSFYRTTQSNNNTLYSGNRAGSRYYYVMENVNATESAQAWSGDLQPGFSQRVTAWVVNPFVKFAGLELFGNIEQSEGKRATETEDRKWEQLAGEGVYRMLNNQVYIAGRYNVATGRLQGMTADVTIDRVEVGGGWFLTPNLMAKAEYVQQKYKDFPPTDIRNGGQFEGLMVEAVVSF